MTREVRTGSGAWLAPDSRMIQSDNGYDHRAGTTILNIEKDAQARLRVHRFVIPVHGHSGIQFRFDRVEASLCIVNEQWCHINPRESGRPANRFEPVAPP